MANPFWDYVRTLASGGYARASQVHAHFLEIEHAFDLIAASLQGSFTLVTSAASPVTAAAGSGYMVDVTSGPVIITLPGSPLITNSPIRIVHVAGNLGVNALTIARNGKPIMGLAENMVIDTANANFALAFSDNTLGWRIIGI